MTPNPLTLELDAKDGTAPRRIPVHPFPFTLGRAPDCHLTLADPSISRLHAQLTLTGDTLSLEDLASRHGTFLNGTRITRHTLRPGDTIQLGSLTGATLRLTPARSDASSTQSLETQLVSLRAGRSDLERLRWFLDAAEELHSAGKVERVLASLLDTTLNLAGMERGFVFLRALDGEFKLALGLSSSGKILEDGASISHTALRQAVAGADQYLLTDSLTAEQSLAASILALNLRSILAIPLRQTRQSQATPDQSANILREVFGVLYLDSSFQPQQVSEVDHELLRSIAREAGALVENAQLAVLEDLARQQKKELLLAASIQQGLMAVQIPTFPFAEVQAQSIACQEVGGDFFDVIPGEQCVHLALVDVSGKGVSAAILASTLQGMLFMQLTSGQPLSSIAAATNRYLCGKNVGKYATMVLARLHQDGTLDYLNCGHIAPRICLADPAHPQAVRRLEVSNLPVGLIPFAQYQSETLQLMPGSRIVLVSDGFTEAEDANGDFFGDDRFDQAIRCSEIQQTLTHMQAFCAGHPATDDITILQLLFRGLTP